MPDSKVFFAQSGSEAVDTALKLARAAQAQAGHPEKTLVVSRTNGYHGTAYGGTSAQGFPEYREGWGELVPGHIHVPGDDVEALARVFAERGAEIAAVITEPVQGAGGIIPPPEGYLQAVRRLCDEHGALYISDEVICGFGRLGHWFGCQAFDIEPDIVTFAKAVTSGYVPLGGVIVGGKALGMLETNSVWKLAHGFTYSGHHLACAAALACIEVTEEEGLLDRAACSVSVCGPVCSPWSTTVCTRPAGRRLHVGGVPARGTYTDRSAVGRACQGVIVRPMSDVIGFCRRSSAPTPRSIRWSARSPLWSEWARRRRRRLHFRHNQPGSSGSRAGGRPQPSTTRPNLIRVMPAEEVMKNALLALFAFALLAAACGDDDSAEVELSDGGTVTLMTHDSFVVSDAVLQAFTVETGISVELLQSGDAGAMVSEAILTKDAPLADVMFGIDNTFLQRGLDAELFEVYESGNLDGVFPELRIDDQHRVTPIDFGDVCVNYWIDALPMVPTHQPRSRI